MRKYNKMLVSLMLCMLCCGTAHGVPAYPTKKTVKLEDGTEKTLQLMGDEFFNFYRAEDGQNYRLVTNGNFKLMSDFEFGQQQETGRDERTKTNARRARRRVGEFVEGGIKGKKKGLVILISFNDKDFVTPDPQTVFNDFFNVEGYSYNGMGGSVADYFRAQSYGQLDVDFDVVGPYKLSKNMAYYGGNVDGNTDAYTQKMAEEACRLANPDVNYADYDWNNDGEVDQVFFIYAGFGENYGAEPNTIWPHAFYLPEGVELDHMKLNSYACTSELMGTKGTTLTGIGTPCHEFSHCLGLPDTYDTSYSGGAGMGAWDIMCSGSYNVNGNIPAGYTAYERWVSGWLEPVEITSATEVKNMKPLTEEPQAYILYNDGDRNEFYILENRQKEGFDAGLPGHGLMVMHIDYDKSAWESNSTNDNPNHQRITYVPADGKMTSNGDAGDPFPGKNGIHNLTDFTSPAATVYNANTDGEKLMHKPIENIMETEGGFLSFLVMKPELAIPVPEISRTEDRLVLNWAAVEGADAYEVRYTELKAQGGMEESCLFAEDFAGTYSASAGFKDVGSELINYLKTSGFSGKNLFLTPDLLRLGSSSKQGELVSPTISALNTGRMTIVLTLKPFKLGEEAKAEFSIYTNSGTQESFDLAFSDKKTFVIHSEKVYAEALRMKLVAETRCYISYFAVYDGVFDIPADQTRAMTRAGI
ncbi:MAG: M6 family metalloprotease domain-containing protein, partial [Bacteroidaceae bacterium]|nr:M6 family metalloprotease domain-containing protein [Bacteroidaceae bacterium]